MEWSREFETGLADIDVQHRYFFQLIHRTYEIRIGTETEKRLAVLDELLNYAECHFGCETALMRAYKYPERVPHVTEHEQILTQVKSFASEEPVNLHKVTMLLFNWFAAHTTLEDRALAKYVIAHRARALNVPAAALTVVGLVQHMTFEP